MTAFTCRLRGEVMAEGLYAARFENDDFSAGLLEQFHTVEAAGVRWNIESFGTERIEVTVRARNRYDIYERMNDHPGQRLALFGHTCHRPISGNITGVRPLPGNLVQYVTHGPAWRHDDQLVRETFPTGMDTDERLSNLLTDYVQIIDTDHTEISATGTDAAEFQTEWPRGNYPSEIINAFRQMSDPSNNPWDYWVVDEPFNGLQLQRFKPYFKNRNAKSTPDWVVRLRDLAGFDLNRTIAELKSFVRIWYGSFEGTVTTADAGGGTLTDSAANFTGFEVMPGDRVTNMTDGSRGKVDSVTSGTQLTLVGNGLQGGDDDGFGVGDDYTIERLDAWFSATAAAAGAPLVRYHSEDNKRFRFEQAQGYANALRDFYGVPVQKTAITVGALRIRDGQGALWPLWEVIARGGGLIRIADLYPAGELFGGSLDSLTTFFITSLDYDYSSGQLRVGLDSRDGRLDARLRAAKIIGSEMVARAEPVGEA